MRFFLAKAVDGEPLHDSDPKVEIRRCEIAMRSLFGKLLTKARMDLTASNALEQKMPMMVLLLMRVAT